MMYFFFIITAVAKSEAEIWLRFFVILKKKEKKKPKKKVYFVERLADNACAALEYFLRACNFLLSVLNLLYKVKMCS